MLQDISYVLLSEEQIQTRVKELAAQLSAEYAGKDPIFVGVLNGKLEFIGEFEGVQTKPSPHRGEGTPVRTLEGMRGTNRTKSIYLKTKCSDSFGTPHPSRLRRATFPP
mgnify:CR=1 FL=1